VESFVAVVDAGSFSGAASKLALSRALVSKRIATLEQDLGTRLLNRTTRRLSVTGTGADFYEHGVRILSELEAARAKLQSQQSEPSGLLKVNGPMSFGTMHLATAVVQFMRMYPRLRVQLALTDRFVDLVDEGHDVAIRIGALADSSLTARRLAPARRIVCASPAYLDAEGTPTHPRDLSSHRCLHYGYLATGTRWHLAGAGGDHMVPVEPYFCVNNGEALLQAAVEGLGIALLPTFICGPQLRAGHLVRVLQDFEPPEIAINAIWPTSHLLTTKVRLFVDFLIATFGDRPYWDAAAGIASDR
jgi:DNA-binding transcriptional LysR family regulator